MIIYTRTNWLYYTYELDFIDLLHIFWFIEEIILHCIFIICTILDRYSLLLKELYFIYSFIHIGGFSKLPFVFHQALTEAQLRSCQGQVCFCRSATLEHQMYKCITQTVSL